jgi:dihydrofolate reductase
MSKVFFDVGISLDGYIAGMNGGAKNPLGDGGIDIHNWVFKQRGFRKHLGMEGGETNNADNDIIENTFNRIGANIMGKRMFVEGEANWPEDAPFHCPVFVLTHEKREPWVRPGGTTFYFTDEDTHTVLEKAKKVAGKKDVRISGGARTIQQFLNAGLIEESVIHIAPVFLSSGVHLFEHIEKSKFYFEIENVINSPEVTHLFYNVKTSDQK